MDWVKFTTSISFVGLVPDVNPIKLEMTNQYLVDYLVVEHNGYSKHFFVNE
jgi:hypothetical protein